MNKDKQMLVKMFCLLLSFLFSAKSGPEMAKVVLGVYLKGDKRRATLRLSSISGQMFMCW